MARREVISIKAIGKGGLSTLGNPSLIEDDESPLMYNSIPSIAGIVETRDFGSKQLGINTVENGIQVLEFGSFPLSDKFSDCPSSDCDALTHNCPREVCRSVYVKFVAERDGKTRGYYMRDDKTSWTQFVEMDCWHHMRVLYDSGRIYFSNGSTALRFVSMVQNDSLPTGVEAQGNIPTCQNTYCKFANRHIRIAVGTRDSITNKAIGILAFENQDVAGLSQGFKDWIEANKASTTATFEVYANTGELQADPCNLDPATGIPRGMTRFQFNAPYDFSGNRIVSNDIDRAAVDPDINGPVYIRFNNITERLSPCQPATASAIADGVYGYDVIKWKGRMWVGGDTRKGNEGLLWFSKGNDTDSVKCLNVIPDFSGDAFGIDPNPSDFIDILKTDNAKFVGFAEVAGDLYVHAKVDGSPLIYKVSENSYSSPFTSITIRGFTLTKVVTDTGAVTMRSISVYENIQNFIQQQPNSATGVSYGLFQGFFAASAKDISVKIRPTFNSTDWSGAAMGVWDRKEFYSGAKVDDCTNKNRRIKDTCSQSCEDGYLYYNDRIIVRDRDLNIYYEIKGWDVSLFKTLDDGFYFGSSISGEVYRVSKGLYSDYVSSDSDGVPIDTYYSLKSFHFNAPLQNKVLHKVAWDGYIENSGRMIFGLEFDCSRRIEYELDANNINEVVTSGCEDSICLQRKGAKYFQEELEIITDNRFKTVRPYVKATGSYIALGNITMEIEVDASVHNPTLKGRAKRIMKTT